MKKILALTTLFITCSLHSYSTSNSTLIKLFPHNEMKDIIKNNRDILARVSHWIEDNVYCNSIYFYGLPQNVRHLIDFPIGGEITYSDALCYLIKKLTKIKYLKLGVSVGKNFYQVACNVPEGLLIGFDFEEINPTLEKLFSDKVVVATWPTMKHSLKKSFSSLKTYKLPKNKKNEIGYLCGDIWDENSWSMLEGKKFNLIFSDAFHSREALLFEYEMIEKYGLLDTEEFILMWDDLGGAMSDAFYIIVSKLKKQYSLDLVEIVPLHGWFGIHEYQHHVGIIMKLKR